MSWMKRQWFPITAGLLCLTWAFLGWLTVIPNQDILADGIQAQSLLRDPRIVLAFPGQKHGGPLEYPATIVAEWLAPGNYFANAAIRPVLAFATGFLVARLFLALFPRAPRWAFLAAVAVGPTIIHGMLGPEGNPVGVWWLQPNWDIAWLCVTGGALVLANARDRHWLVPLGGGLFIGLGFFAHPAITLLIVPLLALVLLRTNPSVRTLAIASGGLFLGVLPAVVSYGVNAKVNTWDPSHGAFMSVAYYRDVGGAVLGLTGIPDYMAGLLPFALGLAPSQVLLSGAAQSSIMWVFALTVLVSAGVSSARAVRGRRPLTPGGAVAVAWVIAMVTMLGFVTFVDAVWIYSSGLAILFWLSIGALPSFIPRRTIGAAVTCALILLVGLSTLTHNARFYSDIPARFLTKIHAMRAEQKTASDLEQAGAWGVFGSYYDAIPVGYASGGSLRTITNHYNRFPLTTSEQQMSVLTVGVNTDPTDPWGEEALNLSKAKCALHPGRALTEISHFSLFDCPPAVLEFHR